MVAVVWLLVVVMKVALMQKKAPSVVSFSIHLLYGQATMSETEFLKGVI